MAKNNLNKKDVFDPIADAIEAGNYTKNSSRPNISINRDRAIVTGALALIESALSLAIPATEKVAIFEHTIYALSNPYMDFAMNFIANFIFRWVFLYIMFVLIVDERMLNKIKTWIWR